MATPKKPAKKDAPPKNVPAQYAGLYGNPDALVPVAIDPATGNEIHRDYQGNITRIVTPAEKQKASKDATAQAAADKAAAAQLDAQKRAGTAAQVSGLNAAYGHAWVNGHLVTVVGMAPDGTPILDYGNGAKTATSSKAAGTTFGALNGLGANTQANATFTMSTGQVAMPREGDDNINRVNPNGRTPQMVDGRQMMTVAEGVQQFLNLSVEHPDQYQHMLDLLKSASYVNPKTPGGYGNDAAVGAAQAMADLAQVNSTPGGRDITLDQFLANKAKDAAKQARDSVQPVNRAYQDPATLAMTAKSAAQSALGRALTPAEEKAFEAAFRGKENAAFGAVDASNQNQAAAAATNSTAPGASYSMPDTAGEADQFVNSNPQFAQEKAGYSALEYTKALQGFLSGGTL